MGETVGTQIIQKTVRNFPAEFKVKIGKLKFGGRSLESTFILEINYQESVELHALKLPSVGCGVGLFDSYADAAGYLAIPKTRPKLTS